MRNRIVTARSQVQNRKETSMPKYMMLLNAPPGYLESLPPEELQRTVERYREWVNGIRASERYVSGEKLMDEGGKQLTVQNGRVNVFDGPYAETKEVIGGYFTIRAASYE